MPQRQNAWTVRSEQVQGEGSFVVMRRLSFGEALRVGQLLKEGADGYKEAVSLTVRAAVVRWNWVDDEGKPLPPPGEGFDLDLLTDEEAAFLLDKAYGKRDQPEPGKN